jgi:uncharacterized protein YjbI with pentapeptide repeats
MMNRKECLERYAIDKNLSGAYLCCANLRSANLSGADLRGAYLCCADLSSANLSSANLRGANLSGVSLSDADLSRASLSDADLRGANLSGANLRGVILPKTFKIARIDFGGWSVCVTRKETTVGCQRHTNTEWLNLTTKDVEDFAEDASEW